MAIHQFDKLPLTIVIIAGYLLGITFLLTGIWILLNPIEFAKSTLLPASPTAVLEEEVLQVARPLALMVGSNCAGTGLTTLSLLYQGRLRALGTVMLSSMAMEPVAMYFAGLSGVNLSAVLVASTAVTLKGAMGLWMVRRR